MQTKAGLDWTVSEVESFVEVKGEKIPTGQKSLLRSTDNKILTNVGKGWNQYRTQKNLNSSQSM